MSEGRKTKSGMHYNYVDRRKAALRSLKTGTAQAAREYGVSEGSIKAWRQLFGLDKERGLGGTMDRYFCQRCQHGSSGTFTGCAYLLHTGEKRPHKDGWCLGFCPRDGTKPSVVERYRKETKKHTGEESEDVHMVDDKVIKSKKTGYTDAEKARVLEYAEEHTPREAAKYFDVSDTSIWAWKKAGIEPAKAEDEPEEEVAYVKLTAEDVPDVPDTEVAETEDAQTEPGGTWDDYLAEKLREHIRELERQLGRYRRMLDILMQ